MKKAFTRMEIMTVFAIMAIIAAIAIPNLVESNNVATSRKRMPYGSTAVITASGIKVIVLRSGEGFGYVVCRIDYGEKAIPRFHELEFLRTELTPIATPVEVEKK
jgi:hypothetical protein